MQATKLSLSPQEEALVANSEWILTKNEILGKVKSALEGLYQQQKIFLQEYAITFPQELLKENGKISKGENYQGLPYLVLDYPRYFKQDHIFAIRQLFWWGKLFSTTLHISGIWKDLFSKKLGEALPVLQQYGFYGSYEEDEWSHDTGSAAYRSLQKLTKNKWQRVLQEKRFIKIAAFENIAHAKSAPAFWQTHFKRLVEILL